MLTTMSAFAQLERDQLTERAKVGMAATAEHGRKAEQRDVTAEHTKAKRARERKGQELKPVDIGKVIGISNVTDYRYRRLNGE